MVACTVVTKLKTERKSLHISWCIIRTRGTCVACMGKSTLSALRTNLNVKKLTFFGRFVPPRVFFFLSFLFLFWGRERERTAKSILQSTARSTQMFQQYSYLLLPAKALLLNLVTHSTPCNFSDVLWCLYCISQFYYMARACKYITRTGIGQYTRGQIFPYCPGALWAMLMPS